MQGSFEKKVQEKLDELRLTPSAPVWEKVELQIRPEKKRRRVLLWIFLPALLLAGGWWLVDEQSPGQQRPAATTAAKKENSEAVNSSSQENNSAPVTVASDATPKLKTDVISQERETETTGKTVQVNTTNDLHLRSATTVSTTSRLKENDLSAFVANKGKTVSRQRQSQSKHDDQDDRKDEPVTARNDAANVKTAPTSNNQTGARKESTENMIAADTTVQKKTGEQSKSILTSTIDSARKKPAVAQHKWKSKILFGVGESSVRASSGYWADLYASAVQSNGQSGYGGAVRPAQKPTNGVSFSLGYALEKPLTNRLSFSAGLQYAYYSTRQKLGMFKPNSTTVRFLNDAMKVSGYYSSTPVSNDSAVTYTNRLHVIEVPVSIQYKPTTLPLYLAAGVSYGRLLSSNVLTYDPSTGVYYENEQNNRKSFFNLAAALQYSVVNRPGWKLNVGPAIQYNLVPLQKSGSTSPHLFVAGIKGAIEW